MKTLDGLETLEIWERGVGLSPAAATLALITAAYPEISPEQAPRLTIGERDILLLNIRQQMFGQQIEGVANCPHCQERLEFSVSVSDLQISPEPTETESLGKLVSRSIAINEYQIDFRLPTVADTFDLANLEQLLKRCILKVTRAEIIHPVTELPHHVIEAVSNAMTSADPQANIQLALVCPACQYAWEAPFDIASFLWVEINRWAQRTILEIHQLASAYGWSEAEILSVSPTRRQIYFSMIGAR